jgi:hypothetical protein
MRLLISAVALVTAAACVPSDRVDFGGVANGVALNGPVVECEKAGIRLEQRGTLTYPVELLHVAYFAQSDSFRVEVPFRLDVNRAGEVVNLQFVGDPDMTRSSGRRQTISNAAESLLNSRFVWPRDSSAAYATDCRQTIVFDTRFDTQP